MPYFMVLLVAFVIILIIIYSVKKHNRRNHPPGPIGLPFVGYLPFLTKAPHVKLTELGRKYGPVFSLQLGSQYVVVLNGRNSMKEAFAKPEFQGRPPTTGFTVFNYISPFFSNNIKEWSEHRRIVLRYLSTNSRNIEDMITDEVKDFVHFLGSVNCKTIDLKTHLPKSVLNIICSVTLGHHINGENISINQMKEFIDISSKAIFVAFVCMFFPWLVYLPITPKLFKKAEALSVFDKGLTIVRKKIQYHLKTFDRNHIRDLIDNFVCEMYSKKENNINTLISGERIAYSISDMLGAGSETISTTLMWCFYTMAAYPNVQKQVQEEIDDVIGKQRSPEFSDRKNMPFSHSVILEVMRWKTVIPVVTPKCTLAESTVSGYTIPKGAIVLPNLWAVHHDPNNWDEPDNFKPERFLSPDRKSVIKGENFIPFSIGQRICPGENVAYTEIFLYFVSILQKFSVMFPECEIPTFEGHLYITYELTSHKLRFVSRD